MEITRKIMVQFERIRQVGKCNMFDLACVERVAIEDGYEELGGLSRDDYIKIISDFGELMEKYNLKQDDSVWNESIWEEK